METPTKTYMAHFRTAEQISPDDWDTCTKSLLVTESTNIGEIVEWYKKVIRNPNADVRFAVSQSDSVPHLNGNK